MSPRKETSASDASPKKPYTTPRLTTYGPVEKLTRSGVSAIGDASHTMAACL